MDNKMITKRKTKKKSEKEGCTVKPHTLFMLELDIRERRRKSPLVYMKYRSCYIKFFSILVGIKTQDRASKIKIKALFHPTPSLSHVVY